MILKNCSQILQCGIVLVKKVRDIADSASAVVAPGCIQYVSGLGAIKTLPLPPPLPYVIIPHNDDTALIVCRAYKTLTNSIIWL